MQVNAVQYNPIMRILCYRGKHVGLLPKKTPSKQPEKNEDKLSSVHIFSQTTET